MSQINVTLIFSLEMEYIHDIFEDTFSSNHFTILCRAAPDTLSAVCRHSYTPMDNFQYSEWQAVTYRNFPTPSEILQLATDYLSILSAVFGVQILFFTVGTKVLYKGVGYTILTGQVIVEKFHPAKSLHECSNR